MARLACQSCGAPVAYDEPTPRDSECETCGTDLRCCRNCSRWGARYSNECTETKADPVQDKTRRKSAGALLRGVRAAAPRVVAPG